MSRKQKTLLAEGGIVSLLVMIGLVGLLKYATQSAEILLPGEIAWGVSLSQVKAQAAGYFEIEKPDALIYKAAFGTYPAGVGYYFAEGKLVRARYTALRKKDLTVAEFQRTCRTEFLGLQEYFTRAYGQPLGVVQTPRYQALTWHAKQTKVTVALDAQNPAWTVEYQNTHGREYLSAEDALDFAAQQL